MVFFVVTSTWPTCPSSLSNHHVMCIHVFKWSERNICPPSCASKSERPLREAPSYQYVPYGSSTRLPGSTDMMVSKNDQGSCRTGNDRNHKTSCSASTLPYIGSVSVFSIQAGGSGPCGQSDVAASCSPSPSDHGAAQYNS